MPSCKSIAAEARMTKKKTTKAQRPRTSAAPTSQLKAIERLLARRDYASAITRLRLLIRAQPDQSGPRRLLVEALAQSAGPQAAVVAALEWAEARPNSLDAQQALFQYALQRSHVMLAHQTATRLQALGARVSGFPLPEDDLPELLRQPDGSVATIEQMARFDIGKVYLENQDFANAVQRLEGLDLIPARNNRAISLFHLGQIEEALAAFLDFWRADAGNLLALAFAARLRLYLGDETGAQGLATPLAAATARRIDDAVPQLEALLLLGHDGAWPAYTRFERTPDADAGPANTRAMLCHLAACAACRQGRAAQAKRLWHEAAKLVPQFRLAENNLDPGRQESLSQGYPAVFDVGQTLPLGWLNTLRATRDGPEAEAQINAQIDALTASNAYLKALCLASDPALAHLLFLILKRRAAHTDQGAAALLESLVRLPIGTKGERFDLLRFLVEQGHLPRDQRVEIWSDGEVRQVKLINTEVVREPLPSDLPEDLAELLGESVACFNDGDFAGAEARVQRLLAERPGHPVASGNLAGLYSAQGRGREARALLRQVVASHPDYLFARCNLAGMLIRDGQIDEAHELLKGLAERPTLHIQEYFLLYGTLAVLNRARGDEEGAQALIATLEGLVEDEDDERRLAIAKAQLARMPKHKRAKWMPKLGK
ncbi:hypothetical protein CKO41_02620 [Thiococcus pfennigii]|nr:hypothetical protein [Thiococcus pfennigii]